jgi:hypothetical protein
MPLPTDPKKLYFCSDHQYVLVTRQGNLFTYLAAICETKYCDYFVRLGRTRQWRRWRKR